MLDGRRILVTGAARGLGAALARALGEAGARPILADILEDEGRETAASLGASFHRVDLGDPDSVAALGRAVAEETGGALHGLVNNGAVATGIGGVPFDEIEIETWDRVMRVNVRGTWLMCRAAAPLLAASGSGRIVNVASDTAIWGAPVLLSYTASKGAVISMTRSLARELGPKGVGVAAVAPGILSTESTEYVPEARHRFYAEGRAAPGTGPGGAMAPEEIAGTVVFLLSEGALAVTGQVLPVNNGFVFA